MNRTYIFLLLISIGILSCSDSKNEQTEIQASEKEETAVTLTEQQLKSLNIAMGKIEKRNMGKVIKVNGLLDVPPQNLVTISAPLGGFVKQTDLLQGMKLKKGQVIALMEHPDYIQLQQDYLDAKNQLELLELEFKRQQELAMDKVNATKTLQQAKANYYSTQVKAEGLKARLKMININPDALEMGEIKQTVPLISPISGYVTQVNVNLGMYVNPTDVMFKIVDTRHLHAEVQVFEKDITRVKMGQRMRFKLVNETKERMADVYLIGREISTERTVRVHCHLEEEDLSMIPGMYFSGLIEIDEQPAWVLPDEAVVEFDGVMHIFVRKEKNTFEIVEIKTGVTDSGFTEVMVPDGFDVNTPIAIKGTYGLISLLKNTEEE
ncbi:MAG: efflux RND transporter periplasmic adaptor subunit [Cyclobacteriaceae bacterium]|nr:efflux RND transporter periplasmic adaptor subunit [Cyclobacteriaceae bacterium]